MNGKWQVTCEGVCKTWRLDRSQELGESSLPVGPQRLYNVADRKWEHDPLHSVGDALGDRDIMLVPGDAYPIDGHNLQNKVFIRQWSSSFLAMYEYLTFRILSIVPRF